MAKPITWRFRWTDLWIYPLVPIPLALMFSPRPLTLAGFGLSFLFNVIATACMGGFIHAAFVVVLPWLSTRIQRTLVVYAVQVATVLVGVLIGADLAARTIVLVGLDQLMEPGANWDLTALRWELARVGLVVSTVLVIVLLTYNNLKDRLVDVEMREERARAAAVGARLEALQSRTNPHFLFNSLNSVASLIDEDPERAERMLEQLSALFRYALDGARKADVTLEQELDAVRTYLDVEHVRFGARLRFSVDVEDGLAEMRVPPLLLQPIVENAVNHGIAARKEGGHVQISASQQDGRLILVVENDDGPPGNHRGTGTSVEDLRERLRLYYAGEAAIDQDVVAGLYRVRLSLPLPEHRT